MGEFWWAESLGSELAKSGPIGRSNDGKTHKNKCEGIENYNRLNRDLQIINYDISINIFLKIYLNFLRDIDDETKIWLD